MKLEGKVAIVTGGALGIGREIARGLAREGASVVVVDLNDAEGAANDIRANGLKALGISADIADSGAMDRMAQTAVEAFGGIDILVNNEQSQVIGPMQAWFERGPDAVYAATDVNLPTAFARVMVLPRALLGVKSSISYVKAEDQGKPKAQRYQVFIDESVDMGAEPSEAAC